MPTPTPELIAAAERAVAYIEARAKQSQRLFVLRKKLVARIHADVIAGKEISDVDAAMLLDPAAGL